jgi:hypothetical protein
MKKRNLNKMALTFKEFLLLESNVLSVWEVYILDEDLAIDHINAHSRESFIKALTDGGLLFRGFNELPTRKEIPVTIDPSKGLRTSLSSNNLYQLMMDSSESLSKYPSRSKSLICTTDLRSAAAYGLVYAVIPKKEAIICTSGKTDLYHVELGGIWKHQIDHPFLGHAHSSLLNNFFKVFLDNPDVDRFKSQDELNSNMSHFSAPELEFIFLALAGNVCEDIQHEAKKLLSDEEMIRLIYSNAYLLGVGNPRYGTIMKYSDVIKKASPAFNFITDAKLKEMQKEIRELLSNTSANKRFTDISSKLMTPTTLGLKLKTYGSKLKLDIECWTDTKCLVIPLTLLAKMLIETNALGLSDEELEGFEKSRYYHLFNQVISRDKSI